jgi:hypothetical protein
MQTRAEMRTQLMRQEAELKLLREIALKADDLAFTVEEYPLYRDAAFVVQDLVEQWRSQHVDASLPVSP